MTRTGCHLTGLALVLSLALCSHAQEGKKPIGLAGASYGKYEIAAVIKNAVRVSEEMEYAFEDRGEALPPMEYGKYSLVVIAHSTPNPLTAEESAAIHKYLRDGGHLLLINQAPRSLGKDIGLEAMPWFGCRSIVGVRDGAECIVLKPNHPFLKGVFDKDPTPKWLTARLLARGAAPSFENLVGTRNGGCLIGVNRVGKGWVAYLGHEFFRLKGQKGLDVSGYVTLFQNIVAAADPLTVAEARQSALKNDHLAGKQVLLWNREWHRGEEYAPRFSPPAPTPEEMVTSLSADMAMDEYETLQLNLTPLADLGELSWEIVPGGLPAGSVRLFVQDRPEPIPWPKDPSLAKEAPYWLMPPEHVAPKGRKEFTVTKGETRVLWLKIGSFGVAPGVYEAALNLSFASGLKQSVPVKLTVYPVRMPRNRIITLQAGGQVYGDVDRPKEALRFTKNLESHGFEWGLLNTFRPTCFAVVGEKAVLDRNYFTRNRQRFEQGDYPVLSFAALDEWMEQAISHGLTNFAAGSPLQHLERGITESGMSAEAQEKTRQWALRELARYLNEKGVRLVVTRYGDELNEKEIREQWLPWAKPLTEAGWACSSTFTGAKHLEPELNELIYPYVKLWTLNRGLMPSFATKLREGTIKMRPDAILGTYGAGEGRGSEHRKPLSMSRFLGWESWMWGVRNCNVNPYFKGWLYYVRYESREIGIAGERWLSFLNKDDLSAPMVDCPFLEGIREGMEDGNLCEILSWYLDRLDRAGGSAAATAKAARARLARVMGDAPDALVQWEAVNPRSGMPVRVIKADNEAFRRGKREVLEIIASIRDAANATIKPSLYWHDAPLVREGRAVAAICAGSVGAEQLVERIANLSGVQLPLVPDTAAPRGDYETLIILGNGTQNRLAGEVLKAAGERDADTVYPGAKGYFIKDIAPDAGRKARVLLIAGPDEEGTRKGAVLFSKFLRAEGFWLAR